MKLYEDERGYFISEAKLKKQFKELKLNNETDCKTYKEYVKECCGKNGTLTEIKEEKDMVRRAFAEMTAVQVEDILGEGYEVKVTEVNKNNTTFTGIVISDGVSNTSPCIYIDQMQDQGLTTILAARKIIEMYKENKKISFDAENIINSIKDRDWLLSNVQPKLVNGNSDDGDYISYPFLDMKCWFYVVVNNDIGNGGRATCGIRNSYTDVTAEELFEAAIKNMSVLKQNMFEILGLPPIGPSMIVITNEEKIFGAAVMANKGILKYLAEEFEDNVMILPSSVHEVICVPYSNCIGNPMVEMVREINATNVAPEDRLSDNVYVYRRNTNDFIIKED